MKFTVGDRVIHGNRRWTIVSIVGPFAVIGNDSNERIAPLVTLAESKLEWRARNVAD